LAVFVGGFEKEIGQEFPKNQVRKKYFSTQIDSYLCLEIQWQYA